HLVRRGARVETAAEPERAPPGNAELPSDRLGIDADHRADVLEAEEPAGVVGGEPALDALDERTAARRRLGEYQPTGHGTAAFEVRQRLLEDGQRELLRRAAETGWRAVEVPHRAWMVACRRARRR